MKLDSPRFQRFIDGFKHAFAVDSPEERLSAEEAALLEKIGRFIVRRGMGTPAVMLLETARPLNYLGSQAMAMLRPLLTTFLSAQEYDRVTAILDKRGSLECLARIIESADDQEGGLP